MQGMKIKYAAIHKTCTPHVTITNFTVGLQFMFSCQETTSFFVGCMALVVQVVSSLSEVNEIYSCHKITGRHNCLWCLIPSSSLKVPLAERGRFTARSLESLHSDHSDFVSSGGGHVKRAKFFNNVIEDYFFDIPLENVKELGLHTLTYVYMSYISIRCAYLGYTYHLGFLIVSGPCWRMLVLSWI